MTCRNMSALIAVGKVQVRNLGMLHVQSKKHWGDFMCEEFEEFRTFYMTCTCGWKAPVKVMNDGFNAYFLHNLWEAHLRAKVETR